MLAVPFLLLGGTSCHTTGGFGSASVVASCTNGCTSIARATVSVSAGLGSDFAPIVTQLSQTGQLWSAVVTQIPAGTSREFVVLAYDASGHVIAAGSGNADVIADAATAIFITLNGPAGPPGGTLPPIIDSLSASPTTVAPGGSVALLVSAHSPNPGDTLIYHWSATCGTFNNATSTTPIWTAPESLGTCAVTISVLDNNGGVTTASLAITVATGSGMASVSVTIDDYPIILNLTAQLTLGATWSGALQVVARSPDGYPLAYAWTSTCRGLAFDYGKPPDFMNPSFSMPPPSAACSIVVTVTDSLGGATAGSLSIGP